MIGIDLRTLALFRALLGLLLLASVLGCCSDLGVFWTDDGVMPRRWLVEADSRWRLSLYLVNGQSWFVALLLALQAGFALMLALGWRTRLATVASFALWVSLLNRNPLVLNGGDLLLCCLLFWAMFLPLGARHSVDVALSTAPPPKDDLHMSGASVGLLTQAMSVYFFSALLKSGSEWWPDFSAVYYALMIDRHVLPLGHWLLNFPGVLTALSAYVYFLELLGPLLIFSPYLLRPLRLALLLAFVAMQLGFLLCLRLGLFPLVSLTALVPFIGGWIWDAAARRRRAKGGAPLRVYYERDCSFCLKSCLLLRQLLVLPALQIAPAQDAPRARTLLEANRSWVVIDIDEQAYLKWPALTVLLRRSPLFGWLWPLLRMPLLALPGNAVYDFVGRHRPRFSRAAAALLPLRETRFELRRGADRIAAVFVLLVLIWNLHTIGLLPARSYQAMTPLFRVLRLDQLWNMFAPAPLKEDGWWVFPARLADGREIDLLHPGRAAPDYGKPTASAGTQESIRWLNYRERLWEKPYAEHRRWYGAYLCRQWNEANAATPGARLLGFQMIYVLERTPPPGQTASAEQVISWRQDCVPERVIGVAP